MLRIERFAPGTPFPQLLERLEIERLSPVNVRFRRYDGIGGLLEDRAATTQEIAQVDDYDEGEAREQAHQGFRTKVAALSAANPLKAILENLIKWKGWD